MTARSRHEDLFQVHRDHLMALAYRMTGSVADAEDVLQEAYLRWERTDPESVRRPRAFLSKTVTRLCLDALTSARARRESYVGPWLPEPVIGDDALAVDEATELAQDISNALLMALERLSPSERAAFLLHDVFDSSYGEVAEVLGKSEAACRQLVSRARVRVRAARPRYRPSSAEHDRVVRAFGAAILNGDVAALEKVLANDAVLYPDGGGRVLSALRPIHGADRVSRFLFGVIEKFPLSESSEISERAVNGALGFYIEDGGNPVQTMAFDVENGKIKSVYVVRNPDKLATLKLRRR